MANTIFFREMSCQCSNGCTDVLLTVIGLSGSKSAQTGDEKNMIIWLMEKDQSAVGMGTVGFDISEMPWKKAYFENQKHFMLQVLDAAREKTGWETLEYNPNEEIIFNRLSILKDMFRAIQVEDIDEELTWQWLEDETIGGNSSLKREYPICKEHGILLSIWGCIACNDYLQR